MMNEAARKKLNQQRLTECFPKFAQRVKAVISDLEAQGFRPLIQDADRSFVKIEFDHTNIEATRPSGDQAKSGALRTVRLCSMSNTQVQTLASLP